jgi:hypothetical protein
MNPIARNLLKSVSEKLADEAANYVIGQGLDFVMSAALGGGGDGASIEEITSLIDDLKVHIDKNDYMITRNIIGNDILNAVSGINNISAALDDIAVKHGITIKELIANFSQYEEFKNDTDVRDKLEVLKNALSGNNEDFCNQLYNNEIQGKQLFVAAENIYEFFKPITEGIVVAEALAQLYNLQNLQKSISDDFDSYSQIINKHFGNMLNIGGYLAKNQKSKTLPLQLINAAKPNYWVCIDEDDNNKLILTLNITPPDWTYTQFQISSDDNDNDIILQGFTPSGYKDIWGNFEKHWHVDTDGDKSTYYTMIHVNNHNISIPAGSEYSYDSKGNKIGVTVFDGLDARNFYCFGLLDINTSAVPVVGLSSEQKVIMIGISNSQDKYIDNFKHQGWIRTSNSNFGGGVPCPEQLFGLVLPQTSAPAPAPVQAPTSSSNDFEYEEEGEIL